MKSDAAAMIIGTSPLKRMSSSPSRTSGTASMIRKKIANSGASLPASAITGLPPHRRATCACCVAGLGADRVAAGERDDHVNDGRQQRAQQELGVVCLRVAQHDRLGHERSDAYRFRPRVGSGCRARGGRREAGTQAPRGNAGCSQVLLVIEADDLRATLGLHVAFEIGGDIERGDGFARPDRATGRREIAGARGNAQTGRGGDLLDEAT